ncbi:hypothetical protein RPB_3424 [Rhodopseudomonas palustris HaA2]|uniref:Uncharacterized protein n=1 Tax=Rhodopseudomonas palustris (strain HaA2) TaxID=316058 RepID=Q2IUJ0_RHOP2|nr:hypothetical protein [Rhodopseudomonas palustris]ABD08120.1 hypothetical protein RPB_3424 [Rhodopseudomonas palustris HaA2]
MTTPGALQTPAGSVFVFNVFSEDMDRFSANGSQVGGDPAIAAWSAGPAPARFTPGSLQVPRTLNPSDGPGKFFNGSNDIKVSWSGEIGACTVPIDGAKHPLLEDLALYVFRDNYYLIDSVGVLIESGSMLLTAR